MYGPVVCDPGSHAYVGVSRLSSIAVELDALMLAVRGVSVALQLQELGVPWLDTSFVSDNRYALGIMQFETRAVANHAQAQVAWQWCWAAKNEFAAKMHVRAHTMHRGCRSGPTAAVHEPFLVMDGRFCKGGGCRDLPLRRAVVDGSAGQARPDDGAR